MNKNAEFGTRLKDFVENNFSSTAELMRIFGRDKSYFTPYYNGKSIPGGKILAKLADLGCDINWLLTGKKKEEIIVAEPKINYIDNETEKMKKIIDNLNEELIRIKAENYDLIKRLEK